MNSTRTEYSHIIRDLWQTHCTPAGISWACAWGTLFGLVPKDNLTAAALLLLLFLLRANLVVSLGCGLIVSLFSFHLDPMLHALGQSVLTFGAMQSCYRAIFAIPWMTWSGLNNTVVVGSLVAGLLFLWPIHSALKVQLTRWWEPRRQWIAKVPS